MPLQFTCIHCGASNEVGDEYAGQTGRCAGCGEIVTVPPDAERTPPVPPPDSETEPPADQQPSSDEQRPPASSVRGLAVLALVVMALVAMIVPALRTEREPGTPKDTRCGNNLKQIGLALHVYHDEWGCFPPAYVVDEGGSHRHSWRVLILPYIEQEQLYEQYRFDEPWNSTHNLQVARTMPSVFRCPQDSRAAPTDTSYVMLVGPGAFAEGATSCRFADLTDGSSNTIAVIEMSGCGILWTHPRDLDATQMSFIINGPIANAPRSNHPHGVNALMADGSVRFLGEEMRLQDLKALVTRAGGERIDPPNY